LVLSTDDYYFDYVFALNKIKKDREMSNAHKC
jgi:hypothetical protein